MRGFFADFEYRGDSDKIVISGDEAKHILKVLRFKIGDRLVLSNFSEQSFEAEILDISVKSCTVKLLNKIDLTNKSKINITIFQGYPKNDKLEFIVQKLTELGIKEIVPVLTKRVNLKIKVENFKLDRLTKIAKEACKQCGVSSIPVINTPVNLNSIGKNDLMRFDVILLLYEKETEKIKDILKQLNCVTNIAVFIGPEGGFEEEEVEYIKNLGGKSVGLGERILRTETAAVFVSSILQYEFGE